MGALAAVGNNYFPETLYCMILVNCPMLMRALWGTAKAFLHPLTESVLAAQSISDQITTPSFCFALGAARFCRILTLALLIGCAALCPAPSAAKVKMHGGHFVKELEEYGIKADQIPPMLGGTFTKNYMYENADGTKWPAEQ